MKENNPRFTDVSEDCRIKKIIDEIPKVDGQKPLFSTVRYPVFFASRWLSRSSGGMVWFGSSYRLKHLPEEDVRVHEHYEERFLATNSNVVETFYYKGLGLFAKNVSSLQTVVLVGPNMLYDAWISIIDNAPKLHTIDCQSLEGGRLVLRNVPLSNVLFSGNNLKHLDLENTCVNFSCDSAVMFDSIRMVNSKITISGQFPVFAKKIVADRKVSEIFSTESQILRSEDMSSTDWGRFSKCSI